MNYLSLTIFAFSMIFSNPQREDAGIVKKNFSVLMTVQKYIFYA